MFCLSVNAQNDVETEKHEVAVEDSTETVAATPQTNSANAGYVAIDEIISKLSVLAKSKEAETDDPEKKDMFLLRVKVSSPNGTTSIRHWI